MSVRTAVNPKIARIVTDVALVTTDDSDVSSSPFAPARSISATVQSMLWGRAAGRCEFAGCNKSVSMSDVTLEDANMAEKAHIRAFSVTVVITPAIRRAVRSGSRWIGCVR